MRLAFCNATKRWGGVKTWTLEFAAALAERGHDIFIYGRDGAFIERARRSGLTALPARFGPDYNPVSIAFFLREFRARGIEAVLVNVGKDLRTAGAAARLLGLPLVQRVGLPGDIADNCSARLAHRLLKPAYLCPCLFIRDGLLRNLPFVRPEECSVIYSAKRPLPAPPQGAHRPRRILSSSQVNANKGHAELAHTLARLRAEGLEFVWNIAGEGACLDELRLLCDRLGLSPFTVFHGFTPDLRPLLLASDIFVLSSYTEGLPNTLLEALAYGLAPVARSVGGVPECRPPELAAFFPEYEGWENTADWSAAPAKRMPLYEPLKLALSAADVDLAAWKTQAWRHCSEHFSLAAQSEKLEAYFSGLTAAGKKGRKARGL